MSAAEWVLVGAVAVLSIVHFVDARLIYWQRRHIAALKDGKRIDAGLIEALRRRIEHLEAGE